MLSINNINPGLKINFQALKTQNKNNNFNLNFDKNNLSGMPHQDVFIKNTNSDNNSQNITFLGNTKKTNKTAKTQTNSVKAKSPIEKVTFDDEYYKELSKEIAKKRDAAWEWMSTRQRYKDFFANIKINKPNVEISPFKELAYVNKKNYAPVYREPVTAAVYNWTNNAIVINKNTFPTMMLISNGKMAILPPNVIPDFLKNGDLSGDKRTKPEDYENLGERDLSFAIESSKKNPKNNYYYKLSPKEASELAAGYLAHEMEHAIVFHLTLNSPKINMIDDYKRIFKHLKKQNKLPENSPDSWETSYPYKYNKTSVSKSFCRTLSSVPINDYPLRWLFLRGSIRQEDWAYKTPVYYYADEDDDLELDAQYITLAYLNRKHWIPTGYNPVQTEKLIAMLEHQKDDIKNDIRSKSYLNHTSNIYEYYWNMENEQNKKL